MRLNTAERVRVFVESGLTAVAQRSRLIIIAWHCFPFPFFQYYTVWWWSRLTTPPVSICRSSSISPLPVITQQADPEGRAAVQPCCLHCFILGLISDADQISVAPPAVTLSIRPVHILRDEIITGGEVSNTCAGGRRNRLNSELDH